MGDAKLCVVIGKESNLTAHLQKRLQRVRPVSAGEILQKGALPDDIGRERFDIVFNNFQTANRLNDISDPQEYIGRSIYVTSTVLKCIVAKSVGKVLYTSSSSVYGNNILCRESDELKPANLHAALKVANEKLVEKFCVENGIDYTIARVFNMYGGDDGFSVIGKIKNACLRHEKLYIVNNGNAIRDFIHIDDVVEIYSRILCQKEINVVNVGTGRGSSIGNILDFLRNHGMEIETESIYREELHLSTADNTLLKERLGYDEFIGVEEYLLESIRKEVNG